MTDKKTNNQKSAAKQDDIQLYRLFAVFGVAILGFAGFNLINESKLLSFLAIGKWFALALLLLSIAFPIYVRCIKKIDESKKIITSVGVSYFLIPLFFMLTTYGAFHNANVKFQIAFAAIALFAVIYLIFREGFRFISALTFVCALFLYYTQARVYDGYWIESVLKVVSEIMIFLVPAAVIALTVLALSKKNGVVKFKDKVLFRLTERFFGILTAILCAFFIVAGILLLVIPTVYLYLMIAILVLYVAIGIICTIRVI